MDEARYRAGYVAIVGRPNVGKSSLVNALLGAKVSIVSKKAQTTRHRIHGILTCPSGQVVLMDTPGFQTRYRRLLNQAMNERVREALADADLVLMVVEALRWSSQDEAVKDLLPRSMPVILAINKVDLVPRLELLPFIAACSERFPFAEIVPLSAEKGENLEALRELLLRYMPPAAALLFPEEWLTDRGERFIAAEYLREKLMRFLGDELPYQVAVSILRYEERERLRRIAAEVLVAAASHKAIVIGKGGERLKRIATAARLELERFLGARVHLEVWVRVEPRWMDNPRLVAEWVGS